jgi:hypothetical protein
MQSRHVDTQCYPQEKEKKKKQRQRRLACDLRVSEKMIRGKKCMHGKAESTTRARRSIWLPTRIMKVIRPRSIARQGASSTFGDTLLGIFAWVLMWLLMLLRRTSLRITDAIYGSRERAQAAASTGTAAPEGVAPPSIAEQVGLADLPLPKQVPSEALAKFCCKHLPPRRAWRRWWRGGGQVPWMVEWDWRCRDGRKYWTRHC